MQHNITGFSWIYPNLNQKEICPFLLLYHYALSFSVLPIIFLFPLKSA